MNNELTQLKNFMEKAVHNAERLTSNIRNQKMNLARGVFNSARVRHLLNNLCALDSTIYLDIGTYRGISLSSALHKNKNTYAYAIDKFNYDPYSASYSEEHSNAVLRGMEDSLKISGCSPDQIKNIIKGDMRSFSLKEISDTINVCYYDGGVSPDDSYKTIKHINNLFSQYAIIVCSNTQNPEIAIGIEKALKESLIITHHTIAMRSKVMNDDNTWWNGVKLWLIERPLDEKQVKQQKDKLRKERIALANAYTQEKEETV
jgi:hypothetical protein